MRTTCHIEMLFIGFALTTFNVQNLKKKVGKSLLSVGFPLRRDNYLSVEYWRHMASSYSGFSSLPQYRAALFKSTDFTLSHYEDER